eukprot:2698539-Pyramimonas_sp.AAC.1
MLRAIDQAVREEEAHGQQTGGHEIEACSEPLFSPPPREGGVLRNMSFVDDLTDYNSTANANDLINTTGLAAARLCTAAFQRGLKPRLEKKKGHPHALRRGGQEGETADSQGRNRMPRAGRTRDQGAA